MENKAVATEILDEFGVFLANLVPSITMVAMVEIRDKLEQILEKRLGQTRALYDPEKLAQDMVHNTTFGWFPDDEPHHSTCTCGECLDRAANEKE